jgi:hypothetical protein
MSSDSNMKPVDLNVDFEGELGFFRDNELEDSM